MYPITRILAGALISSCLTLPALAAEVSPEQVSGTVTVDTAAARALFDQQVAFVDVRKDSDWDAGRIPGAIHLDLKGKFTEQSLSTEVKKEEPIVIYCNGSSCLRSSEASAMAAGWGFGKVHYYRDGFPAWKAAGNPVE